MKLGRRAFMIGCACCGATPAIATSLAEDRPALEVARLAHDVWRHTSWKRLDEGAPFPSNGLIIKGDRVVLIVDTTWPLGDMSDLVRIARDLAAELPVRLAVTHAHDDRMSGVAIARDWGATSLAHEVTQADAPARGLPLADEVWRGRRKRLDLGGRVAELYYPGPAHTRDNVVAFVEDAEVLFGGCQVRAASNTSLGNIADADVRSWPAATRRLIRRYGRRASIVVPGHGEPGGPELLHHTLELAEAAVARSD